MLDEVEGVFPDDGESPGSNVAAPEDHDDSGQEVLEDKLDRPLYFAVERLAEFLEAAVRVEGECAEWRPPGLELEVEVCKA